MAIKETLGLFNHPFMDGHLEVHDDGTTYPKVELIPAGVVLPFEIVGGDTCYVYLLEQTRPECGDRPQLKTVGAYLREKDPAEAMEAALYTKAKICVTGKLHLLGMSIGYSVARTKIFCYSVDSFRCFSETPPECARRRLLLSEAIDKALLGQVMDDCTTIPLLALYRELASRS